MRFWRRFADVSGKIVLAVDKSCIRLPKTDCKCQESTTKCHVLLFYFSVLCFILSPLIEAPHKNKNNWHLLSKFLLPKPERNFKMKCTWKTMHNFILLRFFFIYLFFFVGLTDWNEFFSRLSKYKLTINWQIMHINFLTFLLPLKLPSSCCFFLFFFCFFLFVFPSKNSTSLSDQFTVWGFFFFACSTWNFLNKLLLIIL